MIEETYYNNKLMILMLTIPVTIVAKIFQATALPDKYFYDSSRMLSMLNNTGTMTAWGDGYKVVVDVFSKFNIFGFDTLTDWAIFLATIFSIILIIMFSRIDNPDTFQSIFLFASIFLLNVYVFNISKEIIQFSIFFLMYLIVIQNKLNTTMKVVLCFLIFYWESTFFRTYYLFMGALFVIVYFILRWIQNLNKQVNGKILFSIFIIIFLSVFAMIFALQFVSYDDYMELISVSETHTNEGANTAITNLIEINGNIFLFMVNYVINAVRMMFPVELLTKGVFCIPFAFYQVFILFYLIRSIRGVNKFTSSTDIISIAIMCGYLLGSFTFEPDFGSFVRHEAATFPILHVFALNKSNYLKKSEEDDYEATYI